MKYVRGSERCGRGEPQYTLDDACPSLLVTAGERRAYLVLSLFLLFLARPGRFRLVVLLDTGHRSMGKLPRWIASRIGSDVTVLSLPNSSLQGALYAGWRELSARGCNLVLAIEDDFCLLLRPTFIKLREILEIPETLMVVLVRQRWFQSEYRFRTMSDYLTSRFESAQPNRVLGFFTTNPAVYNVDVVLRLANNVPISNSTDFELHFCEAARLQGLETHLITRQRSQPASLHFGAVTTTKLRSVRPTVIHHAGTYLSVHLLRVAVVIRRNIVGRRPGSS